MVLSIITPSFPILINNGNDGVIMDNTMKELYYEETININFDNCMEREAPHLQKLNIFFNVSAGGGTGE